MSKLDWCFNKNKGIEIVEPNPDLAESYMEKSLNALKTMNSTPAEDWKIVAAYYTCYDALYALLRKCGLKSEIHDCTIEIMNFFGFTEGDKKFMEDLKEKRINAQYYVTEEVKLEEVDRVKDFRLKCRELLEETDFKETRERIIDRHDS